jgi:hypothetical protein
MVNKTVRTDYLHEATADSTELVGTLRDVTVGGRIRKQYQPAVWQIAQKAASRRSESITGNMLTSRQTTLLVFLDGSVCVTRGEFGSASGMFWDGLHVKAFVLYELGFNAGKLLGRSVPPHKELKRLVREQRDALTK